MSDPKQLWIDSGGNPEFADKAASIIKRESGFPDECIVGRGLVNDILPGWDSPCSEPVTEEFIVPIGINPQTGITVRQDVWPFCSEHGKQFQKALFDAQEGACN